MRHVSGVVYKMKSTGPSTEPRGTQKSRDVSVDLWSSMRTYFFLSER